MLEIRERVGWREPGFVGEIVAVPLVRAQGFGLPPAEVQRAHQQLDEALAEGLLDDEPLQIGDRLGVTGFVDQQFGAFFERDQAQLFESARDPRSHHSSASSPNACPDQYASARS